MKENTTMKLFLRAQSLGNRTAYRKVIINFNYPFTNTAPKIDNVKTVLTVSVTEEEQEEGLST